MTRDELVNAVREYANAKHPGWDVASVMVSRGIGREPETLIVMASCPSPPVESQR